MGLILKSLEEKIIAPEVTGVVAMGKAFDSFAMAISLRGDVIAAGAVDTLSCKLGAPNCDIVEFEKQLTSDSYNILNIEGVLATEVGILYPVSTSWT